MWWKEKTGKSVFRKMRYSIGIFLIVACTFGFNGCATEEKDKGHEKQSEHAEGNIRNQIISDSKKQRGIGYFMRKQRKKSNWILWNFGSK